MTTFIIIFFKFQIQALINDFKMNKRIIHSSILIAIPLYIAIAIIILQSDKPELFYWEKILFNGKIFSKTFFCGKFLVSPLRFNLFQLISNKILLSNN